MMEVVLTRLRDFSCKSSTFDENLAEQAACRDPRGPAGRPRDRRGGDGSKLDLETALGWLRKELMEMRSQDQALIRQLMELHSGIQELKQELSEEEQRGDTDEEEEDGSYWDSESEKGSRSSYFPSGEMIFTSYLKRPRPLYSPERLYHRRSSVP